MPFLPPMTGNGNHTTHIFMVMTGGRFNSLILLTQNATLQELIDIDCMFPRTPVLTDLGYKLI